MLARRKSTLEVRTQDRVKKRVQRVVQSFPVAHTNFLLMKQRQGERIARAYLIAFYTSSSKSHWPSITMHRKCVRALTFWWIQSECKVVDASLLPPLHLAGRLHLRRAVCYATPLSCSTETHGKLIGVFCASGVIVVGISRKCPGCTGTTWCTRLITEFNCAVFSLRRMLTFPAIVVCFDIHGPFGGRSWRSLAWCIVEAFSFLIR